MAIDYWQDFVEEGIYHVYNRSVGNEIVFRSQSNYGYFLSKVKKYISPYCDVLAYCLLPNHYHFIFFVKHLDSGILEQIQEEGTAKSNEYLQSKIDYSVFIEDQFKRLFSSYALAFNKQNGRNGALFQKRFKRVMLKDEKQCMEKLVYVHHNPIHHGYVKDFDQWAFSSYSTYISDSKTNVNRSLVLRVV